MRPGKTCAGYGRTITMPCVAAIAVALATAPMRVMARQDLLETYHLAARNAPKPAAARAAAKAADARYHQALGQLLPHISAHASFAKVKQQSRFEGGIGFPGGGRNDDDTGFQDQQSIALTLTQPLFNWSAWQAMEAAAIRAEKAETEVTAVVDALMLRTARRYFDVLAARAEKNAVERQLELIAKQLDRAQAAFEAGLAPIINVQQAQSALDAAQVDAIAARNALANSRDALFRITGSRHPNLVAPSPPFRVSPPPEDSMDQWVRRALAHNPQLAARVKALAAAREEVSRARGRYLPTVELTASVGQSESIVNFGTGNTRLITETYKIGIQVDWPLFIGGSRAAAVAEAQAMAAKARMALVETRRRIKVDTRTAFRNLHASAEQVQALTEAIESARLALEAAKAGMRTGTRNILDVLDATVELVQRRAQRRKAWYDYILAALQLQKMTGQLTMQDLRRVNARLHAE